MEHPQGKSILSRGNRTCKSPGAETIVIFKEQKESLQDKAW